MIKKINILMVTMLGLGNSKYAPGSVASFSTCLIYIYFFNFKINIIFLIFGLVFITIYSVYAIDALKNSFTEIDAKEIVIDEFIGQSIPILTLYSILENHNIGIFILYTFISFIFFRLFDIWKPYPINKIDQNIKNGFGIVLDDVIAGVYSIVILLILIFFVSNV